MSAATKILRYRSWVLFWEGWLFGHFLNWEWAVIWMFGWWLSAQILRAGIALGQKSKETPRA